MLSRIRMGVDVVVLVGFAAAAYVCLRSIDSPTYWFPAFVTVSGTLAAGYLTVADGLRLRAGRSLVSDEVTDIGASLSDTLDEPDELGSMRNRVLAWSAWLVALPVLGLAVPFFYASLVWLVAVLIVQGKKSWKFVVPTVAVFGVFLNVIVVLLEIKLPPAILTGLG